MDAPTLPAQLVEVRRTPLFDFTTLPDALASSQRTTVWAEIPIQAGTVRYIDLEGDAPRDERLAAGDSAVIVPEVEHHVEPPTDAQFYAQFFREPDAAYVDVGQDDLLQPYFCFRPGFIDWQAHIRTVADYWSHIALRRRLRDRHDRKPPAPTQRRALHTRTVRPLAADLP